MNTMDYIARLDAIDTALCWAYPPLCLVAIAATVGVVLTLIVRHVAIVGDGAGSCEAHNARRSVAIAWRSLGIALAPLCAAVAVDVRYPSRGEAALGLLMEGRIRSDVEAGTLAAMARQYMAEQGYTCDAAGCVQPIHANPTGWDCVYTEPNPDFIGPLMED